MQQMQGPASSGAYYIAAPAMAPMPQTEATIKKKKVSGSVSTVHKIPKCHQVDGIQAIEASLDATLSGKCDQDELAVIVWVLTRTKSNFKISELRQRRTQICFEGLLMMLNTS